MIGGSSSPLKKSALSLLYSFSSCPASLLVFVVSFMVSGPFHFWGSVTGGGGRCGCGLICFPFRIPSRSCLVFLVGSRLSVHLDRFRSLPLSDYHYTLNIGVCLLTKQPRYTLFFCAYYTLFFCVYSCKLSGHKKSAGVIPPRFLISIPVYICKKYSLQALLASLLQYHSSYHRSP